MEYISDDEMLRRMESFLYDHEPETPEEVDAFLRAEGIDPDVAAERMRQFVNSLLRQRQVLIDEIAYREKVDEALEGEIMEDPERKIMEDERRKAKDVAEAYAALEVPGCRPEPCMKLLRDRAGGLVNALRHILYDQIQATPETTVDAAGPSPRHEELDERLVQQIEELLLVMAEADKLACAIAHRVAHLQDIAS